MGLMVNSRSISDSQTGIQDGYDDDAQTLVERYAHMAHTFERRPVDKLLRTADIAISSIGLAFLFPILLLLYILLRSSGGPGLYRGQRVGRAGNLFTMYKFRTLRPDAEVRLGPYLGSELTTLTVQETTTIGRLLRATKLDNTQLYNVLKGDMSLVGPQRVGLHFSNSYV